MKLSKPFLAIAICLVLALLYVLFFMGEKPKTAQPVPQQPAAAQAPPAAAPAKATPQAQGAQSAKERPSMEVAWKRDPFELPKPLEKKVQQTVGLPMRVSAIMDGKGGRVAIIDQQIVKRGDAIGQERVVGIEADRVILAREGSQRILTLAVPAPAEKPKSDTKPGGAK